MPSSEKSFVIIPAFNEEKQIEFVVEAAQQADPSLVNTDFITVIDNNSTDNTAIRALAAGARVISCERQGKGWAMEVGARHAGYLGATALTFLDADLIGLTGEHVTQLTKPVVEGPALMAIGYLGGRKPFAKKVLERWGGFSGQRTVSMEVWNRLDLSDLKNWRIEGALNAIMRNRGEGSLIERIELQGLRHIGKREKASNLANATVRYAQTYGSAIRGLLSNSGK